MAASKEGLIDNINCKLTTGGLTDIQASQLAGAAQALCCSSFYAVACEACLPNAALNKGRFVYIQNVGRYKYSNGSAWTNDYCSAKVTANLWAWGNNGNGQLGTGTTTSAASPTTTAGGGTNWCQISTSKGPTYSTSAGVKTDGTLWTWGYNYYGMLGSGSGLGVNRSSPGTTAGGGTTWCKVKLGVLSSSAIKTDGTLWTWGYNQYGILGTGTSGYGTQRSSPGTTAGGGTTWCDIALSNGTLSHAVAVKTDGTLWTWGYNTTGQLGTGTTTTRSSPGTVAGGGTTWCAVAATNYHSAAIKTDGTLWTWGQNSYGQLGDGTTNNRSSPGTTAGGGTSWSKVSAGYRYTVAIKTDGTLWTWGDNASGQLGDGTTTSRRSPGTTAGGGTNWCFICAAECAMGAVKTDGSLWLWGQNICDKFGDGSSSNRCSPVSLAPPAGTSGWTSVASSYVYMMGIANPNGF